MSQEIAALSTDEGRGLYPSFVITSHPPDHVFWDDWFEIGVTIRALSSLPPDMAGRTVIVKAELHRNYMSGETSHLTLEPTNSNIEFLVAEMPITFHIPQHLEAVKVKFTTVRCKIQRRSPNSHSFNGVSFRIRFAEQAFDSGYAGKNIQPVVSNAIQMVHAKIRLDVSGWEDTWYKDEGGRDKCMQVIARLEDKDGRLVFMRSFQLILILVYDNEERSVVVKQDRLRLLGPRKCYIDPDTGKATLQFRIEDVSKNHQGQNFMIKVEAESSEEDVAPAYTPAVSVRSKRNKRIREVNITASSPSIVPEASVPLSTPQPRFHPLHDTYKFQSAIKTLVDWTEDIVKGLLPLRWSLIGYAQQLDGSLDYSQPYHSMRNPNEFISRIVSSYSSEMKQHIHTVQSFVDSMFPSASSSATSLSMPLPYTSIHNYAPPSPLPYGTSQVGPQPLTHQQPFQLTQQPRHQLIVQQQQQIPISSSTRLAPVVPAHTVSQQYRSDEVSSVMIGLTQRDSQLDQQQEEQIEEELENESRKAEICYILAKQFKAIRTGERLGFPAYNISKLLLGFYVESNNKLGVGHFVSLERHREQFGPREIAQATKILEDALEKKSQAVHILSNYDSLASMVDHALVYHWSRDLQTDKPNK